MLAPKITPNNYINERWEQPLHDMTTDAFALEHTRPTWKTYQQKTENYNCLLAAHIANEMLV